MDVYVVLNNLLSRETRVVFVFWTSLPLFRVCILGIPPSPTPQKLLLLPS
jgi:hypothetical protein